MNSKIWLSSPHMGGNELHYIREAIEMNWITAQGHCLDYFEKDLASFLNKKYFVAALNSGTAALHLALIELGVKAGDEVICQTMTFSASANPIAYCGATPVFIDSEKDTWNLCPIALEEAIQDRIAQGIKPKAIIAVHLYGMPYKVTEIHAVAKKYDIPVVEDAAEGLGSTYKGVNCGTFGDFGVLSFNGNKIITTSGGGALVCQTKAAKDKAVFLSTQARDDAPHYQHSQIGYNYRMSNIAAGIGRGQMEVLADRVQQRRANNSFYRQLFQDIAGVTVFVEPSADFFSNHWLSCITLDEKICGKTAEQLRLHLLEDQIESRPLWKPMHLQPVFEGSAYYGGQVAEDLFKTGLCLPSGSNLEEDELHRIATAIRSFFA
ncbi:DegT/DnrJ/EryC1/StrS aminotransferase family protein [Flavobacterium sp. NKUCC04_CG]|uniref:DegT/DnrJ/EryC1/StrS family aminotransferase n=1 Tax=Flavobacterium sp. NKUCC04_CG TaxID=2842121 RepID=UPI001C5B7D64|nr:aminotransferase class I/II-fold pyridoxal phosphate-dependent enzyme [Flavobacterium sp. NKUCC04_CG]MBW3517551.1 aminotransferase class I/II-fold pyridoxal phosphate-dependent enzyme [Flavobacterium sp. NKUCC04_CG]